MASAFSAPDAAIITHQPELDDSLLASTSAASGRPIEELYDVPATVTRLIQGGFQRIALQFPDEILPDSVRVFWALKRELRRQMAVLGHPQNQPLPELYVLADTSYGNCCVDEVAAQHVDADVVVHYGHACLSPTARLPVIYVFAKKDIDADDAAAKLAEETRSTLASWEGEERKAVVLSYDVGYAYAAGKVFDKLTAALSQGGSVQRLPPLVLTRLDTEKNYEDKLTRHPPSHAQFSAGSAEVNGANNNGACCQDGSSSAPAASCCARGSCCSSSAPLPPSDPSASSQPTIDSLAGSLSGSGRSYTLPPDVPLSSTLVLYLGAESLALTNLLLRLGPSCPCISYSPLSGSTRREDGRTNKLLMRRYFSVQQARDASVVALLVGTLGVKSYLPLLAHLRRRLTDSGRKVYTISVGKLSPAKLANFQEVDIFVLLACPENSLVDAVDTTRSKSKDFYRPIVTPFEMLLALDSREAGDTKWTGEYELELQSLLRMGGGGGDSGSGDKEGNGETQPTRDISVSDQGQDKTTSSDKAAGDEEEEDEEADMDRPHFSLVTGKYVSRHRYTSPPPTSSASSSLGTAVTATDADAGTDPTSSSLAESASTLTLRNKEGENHPNDLIHHPLLSSSASAHHLSQRSWRGLEQRYGLDPPAKLEQGRLGIARGYRELDDAVAAAAAEGQEGVGEHGERK